MPMDTGYLLLLHFHMNFICSLYNDVCCMAYVALIGAYGRVNSKETQTVGSISVKILALPLS